METPTPPSETSKATTGITDKKQPKPDQMSKSIFEKFTNRYSLRKTLRFELIPQGKTIQTFAAWIKELENKTADEGKNLLHQDILRAQRYEKVKKILDEYHKDFIEQALAILEKKGLKGLDEYKRLYDIRKKEKKEAENFEKVKTALRKQIARALKGHEKFSMLNKDELFKGKKTRITADCLRNF